MGPGDTVKFANVSFIGSTVESMASVAASIARKGTESDLLLYDKREGDIAVSIVIPQTYPEKIQPLLQSLYMSDASVIFADTVDARLGEEIVAIGNFGLKGLIVADEQTGARVRSLIGSRVQGWSVVNSGDDTGKKIWEFLLNLETPRRNEAEHWRIDVDHSFEVKGVGTVALGVVRYGTVRVHDKLIAMPGGREGSVRSIQIFDVDHQEAGAGSRVGVALRGLSPPQLPRGTVLTDNMRFESARSLSIAFQREAYYRDELAAGKIIHVNAGLQCNQGRIIEVSERLELELDQEMAFENENAVVFSAKPPGSLRIAGSGKVSRLIG
jgi:selenocysteine-specific translation elongation factor